MSLSDSQGLLGWAQKDLQSEFGIAGGPHPGGFRPSTWSQDASRDYGLGGASPLGDPGLGERDWAGTCGHGVGEGRPGEWAGRCALDREEKGEVGGQDRHGAGALGSLGAQDRAIGKPGTLQSHEVDLQHWEFGKRDSQGTYSSRDVELQDQEFGKRDSQGTYSSRDAELQDQEFRKRDSLGTYSGRDASLQDWDFGKRDALGAYSSRDEEGQGPESGQKDPLGRYSGSQDAGQQDQGFRRSNPARSTYGPRGAETPGRDFGRSAWVPDYSGGLPRDFGARALSSGFSLEEAQRQDTEFEKKTPGRASPGAAGRDVGWPETPETGGVFPASGPQPQDGALGQRDPGGWQGGAASREVGGPQAGGAQSPGEADSEDRDGARRGWAGDFGLGVGAQPEAAFGPGRRGWGGSFCAEASERSSQFGIIGDDRAGAASLSPCGQLGGGPFLPPEGAVDWTDQLGLRNLEVSSCVRAASSSEAREDGVGQTGWADRGAVTGAGLAGHLQGGGAEAPGGLGVGDHDWTSDVGGPSQAREGGVGQTDWSGAEAGEFLKSREHGVGQADWTPDPRDRELGPGGVDWGDSLGLRHLEVPCDLDTESSQGPRGCGLDQVDWAQDSEFRNVELPGEARECGVGDVGQSPEPGVGNDALSTPRLEARGPSEARELGVGEMSGLDAEDGDPLLPLVVICPEEDGYGLQESPAFGPR